MSSTHSSSRPVAYTILSHPTSPSSPPYQSSTTVRHPTILRWIYPLLAAVGHELSSRDNSCPSSGQVEKMHDPPSTVIDRRGEDAHVFICWLEGPKLQQLFQSLNWMPMAPDLSCSCALGAWPDAPLMQMPTMTRCRCRRRYRPSASSFVGCLRLMRLTLPLLPQIHQPIP